jgi:hypothetical protein
VVFSFNLSYSQDANVDAAFNSLQSKSDILLKEISPLHDDLRAVSKSFSDETASRHCTQIIVSIREGSDLISIIKLILASREFVDKEKMKSYFQYMDTNLRLFYYDLTRMTGGLEIEVKIFGVPPAVILFTKKAIKIFDAYLAEMESTITVLDNAIKSMP